MNRDSTPEPFLDWFGIWPGGSGYEADGRGYYHAAPKGVELVVQPPLGKRDLNLQRNHPWEDDKPRVETLLQEDGRFRMWYSSSLPDRETVLCYAESEDGFEWHKPELGLYEFDGSTGNNIVGAGLGGAIFLDTNPNAPDSERYKLIFKTGAWNRSGASIAGAEDETDALVLREKLASDGYSEQDIRATIGLEGRVMGAVSPDGLRWKALETPLLEMFCDCDNIAFYDQAADRYVGYFRHNMFRETIPTEWPPNPWRCIGRAETDDFRRWPTPHVVLQPDLDEPTLDLYTNAYAPYPGDRYHLMFPSVYYRGTDARDVQLAVSRNGHTWTRYKSTLLARGSEGSNEEGMMSVRHGIFSFDDNRWGLLYVGMDARHNESYYYDDHRVYSNGFAFWKRDRFVGLEAEVDGQVTLLPRVCGGGRLLLNFKTETGGWVRAAFMEPMLWPPARTGMISGFSFDDCEPLRGDQLEGEVRFHGSANLSELKGRNICLCLELFRATVFATTM